MAYSLVFTIYSLIFSIFLLITIFFKKKNNTPKSMDYLYLIASSLVFGVLEIIAILYYKISLDFDGYAILWKIRNFSVLYYVFFYITYCILLVRGEKYKTFRETIFKTPLLLVMFIFFTLLGILYVIFVDVAPMGVNELKFVRGIIAVILVGICFIAAVSAVIFGFIVRKTRRNIFRCMLLIAILFFIVVPIQLIFEHISFMPFISMFLLYIIYYNIENPDIEMLEDVSILKESIDKSSNSKTDFLFNLSTDLVNPMNTIVSLSESICNMDVYDDSQVVEDLNNIKYAGNILLDSINNILDMNEGDSADKINIKQYSFVDLVNRLKSVTLSRIGAKQITFDVDIDQNISSKLSGDIVKIQKVLLNILNNSVKFTEVGKIKLIVTCTNEKNNIQVLHFKISDTGCGINDSQKSFVFSGSTSSKSGIGLAVSKQYIEAMGGEIRFESSFGAGTTFFVDLPQGVVGSRLVSEDMINDDESTSLEVVDLSKFKVLIVDDDELDIKVTSRILEKYNVQITCITSSIECIDRIKREEEFHIIFLDHKMPDVDGIETLQSLKQLEGYNIPKIVCLTANAISGAREFYISNGFDDYLSKPIDINELDRIMKKFCK